MSRGLLALGLLALGVAVAPPLARAGDASGASPSVLVTLTRLTKGSLPRVVVGYGTVEPSSAGRMTVMAPVSSIVVAVEARLGEEVPAAAPLIRLEPSPATAASYAQARSALAVARRWVASTRQLVAGHLATSQQLADAEKSESDARAQLRALVAVGAAGPRVVRAPIRAIVTAVAATAGAIVPEGAALLDLAAPGSLVLTVGVVPADAAAIHSDERATVQLVGASRAVAAKVLLRGAVVAADTGLVPVEVALPPGQFLPGEMAEARITTAQIHGYVVPHDAILVDHRGAPYVVQAVDNIAHKVPVRILNAHGDRDVIAGALDERAPLVLSGNHQLDDGMRIRLADPPAAQVAD